MRSDMEVKDASINLGCGCTRCKAGALTEVATMLEQDSREDAGFVLLLAAAMLLPEPARWSSAVPLAFSLARVSDEAQPRPQTGTAH